MKKKCFVLCGLLGLMALLGSLKASKLSDLISRISDNNDPTLTEVKLCPIGGPSNKASQALFSALASNMYVTSVVISPTLVNNNGVCEFNDDCLTNNDTTTTTTQNYQLNGDTIQGIINCLDKNKTLTKLVIDNAIFDNPSATKRGEFFEAIKKNTYLKELGLNNDDIQVKEFCMLLQNTHIKKLSLKENKSLSHTDSNLLNSEFANDNNNFSRYLEQIWNQFPIDRALEELDIMGTDLDKNWPKTALEEEILNNGNTFKALLERMINFKKLTISKEYGKGEASILKFN